jgi:membrane protease YdiL (CAAX protease family)
MPTLRLLGGVLVLLGGTAVLSPLVAMGLDAIGWEVAFSRAYNRVFEVLLVLWLLARRRRLDLGSAETIGLRHARWRPDLVSGFAVGVAGLSVALGFCYLAGGLVLGFRYPDTTKIVWKTVQGLGAAVAVGTFEEVIFRGVLLRRLSLDLGARAGLLATTTLYAAVHLLHPRSARGFDAWAGVRRTLEILAPLGDVANLPTFLGLFAFGMVLATTRVRTGSLWMAIGVHAAWVALFRVGRVYFRVRYRPAWLVGVGWPPLIGSATGAVALIVTAGLVAWVLRRREQKTLGNQPVLWST